MDEKEKIKNLKKLYKKLKKITPPDVKSNYILRWFIGGIIGLIGLGAVLAGTTWMLIYSILPNLDTVSGATLDTIRAIYYVSVFIVYILAWILRGIYQEHSVDTWIWRKGIEETKALIAAAEHNLSLLEYQEVERQKLIAQIHQLNK